MKVAGLPAPARLRQRADFARINHSRGSLSGRYFRIRHEAGAQPWPRLGMAVSRKVSKLAVVRNRIKRCVRESFRQHRQRLPAMDLLLLARPEAATATNAVLRDDLENLWARLAALKSVPVDGTIAR